MEKISDHINSAYQWLSQIAVTGDNVDCMAMARQALRAAHKLAAQIERETAAVPEEVSADG